MWHAEAFFTRQSLNPPLTAFCHLFNNIIRHISKIACNSYFSKNFFMQNEPEWEIEPNDIVSIHSCCATLLRWREQEIFMARTRVLYRFFPPLESILKDLTDRGVGADGFSVARVEPNHLTYWIPSANYFASFLDRSVTACHWVEFTTSSSCFSSFLVRKHLENHKIDLTDRAVKLPYRILLRFIRFWFAFRLSLSAFAFVNINYISTFYAPYVPFRLRKRKKNTQPTETFAFDLVSRGTEDKASEIEIKIIWWFI